MNGAFDKGCALANVADTGAEESLQPARSSLPLGRTRCRQHPAAHSGSVAVTLIDQQLAQRGPMRWKTQSLGALPHVGQYLE
ncbi:hypothetical protein NA644_19650 [Pseudomonas stutzeri]|uniref:Uncharacterized protein n=1 Tax=Stutzerimonas stutzeri TaxID=316 RepID=A0A2N8SKV7_STUST|nr:hypothetical protein [Stutzerimonas stutzeri]EQM80995.1 hypothetical protein L686_08165 [Stutzerimonas stutzeri MF28]MCQ4251529.1 hypothetical protein [Stutzerimonas stutzeri]PNG03130.1 hypothetical protein CXL00_22080 [Stutzerimonas stutzeri]